MNLARELEGGEKIASPEQLNEYIKVAAPGAWVLLSAALLFFAGMFYGLFTGTLEVTIPIRAYKEGSRAVAFVPAEEAYQINPGMAVRIWSGYGRGNGTVASVSGERVSFGDIVDQVGDANVIRMGLDGNHRLFQVTMDVPDGPQDVVRGSIIRMAVHPADFLLRADL